MSGNKDDRVTAQLGDPQMGPGAAEELLGLSIIAQAEGLRDLSLDMCADDAEEYRKRLHDFQRYVNRVVEIFNEHNPPAADRQ